MLKCLAYLGPMAVLVAGAAAGAAQPATDQCATINYLLAQARTEFPALKHAKLNARSCTMAKREFRCEWGFPGDRFDAAKQQSSRLTLCIAAEPRATPLKAKGGEVGFQLNSETSAYVRGPEMDSGDWTLTLRIVSTADWN
jgi:hypothetical protein